MTITVADIMLTTITDARLGNGLSLYQPVGKCDEIIEVGFIMWITTRVPPLGRGQILSDYSALPTGKVNELR